MIRQERWAIEDRASKATFLADWLRLQFPDAPQLEGLDTPEAKKLLEELAQGAADAALTREAKAALERMGKRSCAT